MRLKKFVKMKIIIFGNNIINIENNINNGNKGLEKSKNISFDNKSKFFFKAD